MKAGQTVAMSGDLLHIGVRFKGEEMDPLEFLAMLYGNIKAMQEAGGDSSGGFYDTAPETDYEQDREEIERLMFRFLPLYMDDLRLGRYAVPEHGEICGSGTHGAVAAQHLHDRRDEGVFL